MIGSKRQRSSAGSSKRKRRICHEISATVFHPAVQLGGKARTGRTIAGRDCGTYRSANRRKTSLGFITRRGTAPSHAQVWRRGGDETRLSSRARTAIYRESAGGFAKRRANDLPHARACGRDHRFACHRNWREYNDLFMDSDDPAPTVARREWCIELSAGRASHGDGRVSRRFMAGISRLADASAGTAGRRGISDGAVQRGRDGQTERTFGQLVSGNYFSALGL